MCFLNRADLEAARTLADQVRRREKLHKQDMAAWKLQVEEHLRLPADDEVIACFCCALTQLRCDASSWLNFEPMPRLV